MVDYNGDAAGANDPPERSEGTLADTDDHLKVLYYGPAKRFKTTYAAGAARLGKIFVVDTEGNGWLKRPLIDRGIPVENIIYRKATTYNEMEEHYWELDNMLNVGQPIVAAFVDHLSDLEQRFIRAATMGRQLRKANLGNIPQFKQARKLIEQGVNPFQTELADYGVWTNQARHLMRLYRDAPCHVGFIAHQRIEMGQYVPGLTEKFREELMGSLNLIVGCDVVEFDDEQMYGVGVCRETGKWRGGDRIGITRPKTVRPSMDRLILALRGELDFANDSEQLEFKKMLALASS